MEQLINAATMPYWATIILSFLGGAFIGVANNYYAAYCTYNYCRRGGHARKTYIQTGTSEMAIKKGKIWI